MIKVDWVVYSASQIRAMDNEQFLLFIWQLDLRQAQSLYHVVDWYKQALLISIIM